MTAQNDQDDALWQAVSSSVRPLKSKKVPAAFKAKHVSIEKKLTVAVERPSQDPDIDYSTLEELSAGDIHHMDKNTAQRFRNGEMEIEAVLDLHGYTLERGEQALRRFILTQSKRNARCLLVITGKGGIFGRGIIKAELPLWLNLPEIRSLILSYVPAKPKDGGEGAFYILLKRNRKK